ncbi:hypothetical protein F5I97DRAFT_1938958 [Phlebopus sp. FC_14]|nr:hypothetical protein F5I97DRAFT_1938958 [Phlebopus sp. FC_14]
MYPSMPIRPISKLVELGLALLDLCPGPVVVFVDPRLHDNASAMVTSARSLVAQFDKADVRRWRVIMTLPATEDGIRAADELTHEHAILTNLTSVSCLPHASACIEAGAKMLTMSVGPILEWFEQQHSHPGIEVIQSCASYIHHNKSNTSLIAADIRNWSELKQLNGIGGAALSKHQLEQIPMQRLATWYPRSDDTSPAALRAREADYPSKYMESKRRFMSLLPADCRSLVSAVLYVRLGTMKVYMETMDKVIRKEVRRRIELQTMDLSSLYRRPTEIPSLTVSAWVTTRGIH